MNYLFSLSSLLYTRARAREPFTVRQTGLGVRVREGEESGISRFCFLWLAWREERVRASPIDGCSVDKSFRKTA